MGNETAIFGIILVCLAGLCGVAILLASAFLDEAPPPDLSPSDGADAQRPDVAWDDVSQVWPSDPGPDDFERQARQLRRIK